MKIKMGCNVVHPAGAQRAEQAGFDSVWVVDHFYQFSHRLTSGAPEINTMSLALMPAVLAQTRQVPVGVSVICPLFRYHPAVLAQYFAQLDYMFPGRVILGVGTGEAINEVPFLGSWPPYRERRERLIEAVQLIRQLWASPDFFDYQGKYYQLQNGYLYLKPKGKIPIIISAAGPRSARMAGRWGDGLMILGGLSPQTVAEEVLPAFIQGAQEAGKDPEAMPRMLWTVGGLTSDPQRAAETFKGAICWIEPRMLDESDPRRVDELAKQIPVELILQAFPIVSRIEDLIERLEAYVTAGANEIILYDMTPGFTRLGMGSPEAKEGWQRLLPYFRGKYG